MREIIENVAEGSTLYAEAKRLNDLGLATPGWRYGNGKKRPGAKLWSVMTVSNIVRQSAYSGVHRVKDERRQGRHRATGAGRGRAGPPGAGDRRSRERTRGTPTGENDRRYLLRGLVRCAACGGACTGHSSARRGKKYHYYACKAAKTYNFGGRPRTRPPT